MRSSSTRVNRVSGGSTARDFPTGKSQVQARCQLSTARQTANPHPDPDNRVWVSIDAVFGTARRNEQSSGLPSSEPVKVGRVRSSAADNDSPADPGDWMQKRGIVSDAGGF